MEAFNFIKRRHYPVIGGSPDYGKISTLIGESRAGKSAVAKKYLQEFPPSVGPCGMNRPVLYVMIPTDTERALLSAICNAMGMKPTLRMSNPVLWTNIESALPQQKVELLLFDEVNTVVADGKKQSVTFSLNIFRKLTDLCHINIVCIGLEETYQILASDPQIRGRGGLRCHVVRPYSWDNEEERRLFRLLCDEFDHRLPFDDRSNLASPWTAHRLFYSSRGGVIGQLSDFLFDAGSLALNEGATAIAVRHFAQVYEDLKGPGSTFNPWTCEDMSRAPKLEKANPFEGKSSREVLKKS
jgi:hypothetical protein